MHTAEKKIHWLFSWWYLLASLTAGSSGQFAAVHRRGISISALHKKMECLLLFLPARVIFIKEYLIPHWNSSFPDGYIQSLLQPLLSTLFKRERLGMWKLTAHWHPLLIKTEQMCGATRGNKSRKMNKNFLLAASSEAGPYFNSEHPSRGFPHLYGTATSCSLILIRKGHLKERTP